MRRHYIESEWEECNEDSAFWMGYGFDQDSDDSETEGYEYEEADTGIL